MEIRIEPVLVDAMTTKAIWSSHYGRRRAVMIVMAAAATMVDRMVGKEDEVLGSQEDIGESKDFFSKLKR